MKRPARAPRACVARNAVGPSGWKKYSLLARPRAKCYAEDMIIKNIKNTREDRRYFEEKGRIKMAADAGRLGKSWFRKDPRTGQDVLSPKKVIKRV